MTKRKWNHLTAGVLSFQTHTSRRISHPYSIIGWKTDHYSFIFSLRPSRTGLHGDLHTESLWADASGPLIYHVSLHCHSVTKSFLLDMDPFGEGAVRAGLVEKRTMSSGLFFFTQDTVRQEYSLPVDSNLCEVCQALYAFGSCSSWCMTKIQAPYHKDRKGQRSTKCLPSEDLCCYRSDRSHKDAIVFWFSMLAGSNMLQLYSSSSAQEGIAFENDISTMMIKNISLVVIYASWLSIMF